MNNKAAYIIKGSVKVDPLTERYHQRNEQFLEKLFNEMFPTYRHTSVEKHFLGSPVMDFDFSDTGDLRLTVAVTGFNPEDLNCFLEDGVLVIEGKHKDQDDQEDKDFDRIWHKKYHKIKQDNFVRRLPLPTTVDVSNIQSIVKNGILTVFIPAKEKSIKQITIQS